MQLVARWAVAGGAMAAGAVEPGIIAAGAVEPGIISAGIVESNAAFGVFLRLEVLDFDFLTFLCCHLIFLSGWFVLCQ